ncbi:MAG: ribosome-associated translation inhibitor RaiA [Flavobacteriales bacterium]|nr:ribosome-associated translation inhibitor RaiA [Flavobacteriales bacterium]
MQISVHSIQFKADIKLINFIESRLEKLELFHDKLLDAIVYLKVERNNERGNKMVEIKLNMPGKDLFAKRQAISFEEATDQVVEALRRQIKKTKEKRALV